MYSKLTKVAEFSTWNHCVCTDLHYTHTYTYRRAFQSSFSQRGVTRTAWI